MGLEPPGSKPAVTARRGAGLWLSVPECHRSALLNMITEPVGATIFTSFGCGPIPDPNASMSMDGSLTRCEPGITRSGPSSGVNALMHHMADSVCHRPSVRRCSKSGCSPWWPQPGRGARGRLALFLFSDVGLDDAPTRLVCGSP